MLVLLFVLELYKDTGLCDIAANALVQEHLKFFNCIPGQVKAIYHVCTPTRLGGHTALHGWAKHVLGRLASFQEAGTTEGSR